MRVNFRNLDTNTDLILESDKNFIVVYGKNGVGKTTLSRSSDLDSKFVFNEDFIHSNVFTISEEGASQTVKTKENFSGLWLGKELVDERKNLMEIVSIFKQLSAENEDQVNKIVEFCNKCSIPFNKEKINFLVDVNFKLDIINIDKQKSEYVSSFSYDTTISDADDFKKKINQLKENSLFNMLIEKINSSDILSNIVLKKENNILSIINDQISLLNTNKKLVEEVEKISDSENLTSNTKLLVEEWYKIHVDRSSCLFCGNPDIKESFEKWKKLFEDKLIKEKQSVISFFKKEISICETILSEPRFVSIDNDITNCIKEVQIILDSKSKEIENNAFNALVIDLDIDKKEVIEASKLIDDLINFTLEQNKNILGFYLNALKELNKIKDDKIEKIDEMMDKTGEDISKSITEKLNDFGLNKRIEISVDKRSTPHKFVYSINGHSTVSELSDGQKHKLALAVFVNYLESIDLADKVIVIDDPVVALDVAGYILFRQYLIRKLFTKFQDSTKLILLTHDISYLYVQLSSIFNNQHMKNITELFKMTSTSLEQVPLDFIKTDDITLFRDALNHISNLSELRVLNRIFIKMFRILVDLKLRFCGKSLTDGIGIEFLNIDEAKIEKLNQHSKYIVTIGRRNTSSDKEILEAFIKLKESADILGFDDFILESDVSKIKEIIEKNIDGSLEYEIFEVIDKVGRFLKSDDANEDMKHYVDHTRNSYSQNLIALGLDDSFK